MRSLLVDTAGPVVGVAAWRDGVEVGVASVRQAAGTDGWLAPRLVVLLEALGGLDRVGVSVGPGAFTGVRVGVATALGLALARGVPVVALSSLALRAARVPGEARVLALLDARKGRVYAGWFDTRGPRPVPLGEEGDLLPEQAAAAPPGVVVGEGAVVYATVFAAAGHRPAEDPAASPVAAGQILVDRGEAGPADQVLLRYLRAPDARPPGV